MADSAQTEERRESKLASTVVAARRKAEAARREKPKEKRTRTLFVHRCATCEGIGIVYVPGFDPRGSTISSENWIASYREDPSKPWMKREIWCQECLDRGQKVPLRISYDVDEGSFRVQGRLTRFVEEYDVEKNRYVRHVEQEERDKAAKDREALALAQLKGLIDRGVIRAG